MHCRKTNSYYWIHMRLPWKDGFASWICVTMRQADIQSGLPIWHANLRVKCMSTGKGARVYSRAGGAAFRPTACRNIRSDD